MSILFYKYLLMNFVDYELNTDLIAKNPTFPRDHCKLMIIDRKSEKIEEKIFYQIEEFLGSNDVLVFNDTKVIKARLIGSIFEDENEVKKDCELFLIREIGLKKWEALSKPGKQFKVGRVFKKNDLEAEVIKKNEDGSIQIEFKTTDYLKKIEENGEIPLPPYIKNSVAEMSDYQTVYAQNTGSVAAPTAGLHFTENLLKKLESKGVKMEFLTLHVGRGTFQTIKEDYQSHKMHAETAIISKDVANRLNEYKKSGKRIVAVGSTSVRTLEGFFSKGKNKLLSGEKEVDIYIYHPYEFEFVDAIITNFHLPKSTLLLMMGAFCGPKLLKRAYEIAVKKLYRFFSFGDAMFIE